MSMRVSSPSARAAMAGCLAALLSGFAGSHATAKTLEEDHGRCFSDQHDANAGDIAERIAACTHVISAPGEVTDEGLAVAYYVRGYSYDRIGELARAVADYTQSVAYNPKFAEPYSMRALTRMHMGQLDDALRDANLAVAADPKSYSAYTTRVTINMAREDYAQARDDTNYIIQNFPQSATDQYYQLAEIYLQLGDMDRALAAAETSVKVAPNYLQSYEERARILFAMQHYKDVVPDASVLIRVAPRSAEGYFLRSFSRAMLLDFGPALADVDAGVALAPGEAQSLAMRCEVRAMANQRIDEALADCNAAVQRDPKRNFFHIWGRGMAYLRKGMNSEALADLDVARREEPDDPLTLYLHGVAQVRSGKTAEGRAEIAKAQQQDKANCDAFASMGFAA
jgi:tetratricopeptide (TPR) repeat protein